MIQRQTLQQVRMQPGGGAAGAAAGSGPPPPTTHRMRQEQNADRAQPALMASAAAHGRVAPPRPKRRRPPPAASLSACDCCWSFCKIFATVGLVLLFILVEIAENGPAFWHIKSQAGHGRPELAMRLLHQPNANGTDVDASRLTNGTGTWPNTTGELELEPHQWLHAGGSRRWRKALAFLQAMRTAMEAYLFHKDPSYVRGGGGSLRPQQQVSSRVDELQGLCPVPRTRHSHTPAQRRFVFQRVASGPLGLASDGAL